MVLSLLITFVDSLSQGRGRSTPVADVGFGSKKFRKGGKSNTPECKESSSTSLSPAIVPNYVTPSFGPLKMLGLAYQWPKTLVFFSLAVVVAFRFPIPGFHIFFSITYPLYLGLANRLRFDRNSMAQHKKMFPMLRDDRGPWFKIYFTFFSIIGLPLPVLLLSLAPSEVANAAAPHLYLVVCQVIMESMFFSPNVHVLPRFLIPIGFNTYRIGVLFQWVQQAWTTFQLEMSSLWSIVGLMVAVTSLVGWAYNLFVFLLFRMLPQYLDSTQFPDAKVDWKAQLVPIASQSIQPK